MSAELLDVLISWFPMIVILIIWAFVAKYFLGSSNKCNRIVQMNEELVTLNREMAESLRNIEELLKDRKH